MNLFFLFYAAASCSSIKKKACQAYHFFGLKIGSRENRSQKLQFLHVFTRFFPHGFAAETHGFYHQHMGVHHQAMFFLFFLTIKILAFTIKLCVFLYHHTIFLLKSSYGFSHVFTFFSCIFSLQPRNFFYHRLQLHHGDTEPFAAAELRPAQPGA